MKVIDAIRKMTTEAIDDAKWPGRRRGITRAFESINDGVERERLDTETKVIDLEKRLCEVNETEAREIIKQMDDLDVQLEEAEKAAARIAKRQVRLFSDAKEQA